MKYCPKCGGEYFDDIASCEECNAGLVSEQEWVEILEKQKVEDEEVFVKVAIVDNQFEADVIKDALEKEDIPVLMRSFRDTSFDGIYIPQKGWGSVHVPEEFREKAQEVIEAVDKQKEESPDSTTEE